MEIYFNNKTTIMETLYEGYEDVPRLAISVHLHGWEYPQQAGKGIAKFRVEIREGSTDPKKKMVGQGFVQCSEREILNILGYAPLSQAILDGLLSHTPMQNFFMEAAKEGLDAPEPEPPKPGMEGRKMPPAKAFHNPRLYVNQSWGEGENN
ncbi:hypothetical protein Mmc1_1762 [Magnetococcus marinus MC-1]|uniref:Uncharacterized protein n=1 Tax=Magnetococcus marinus (strain ATCC BAA-1437 / JCM 17883 / MC-1) TaxID=156889 RepID=A0L8H7_MAGMM|nr:hypothetical protein [Magnetococcus marinus]ABK44270.1 hypothetical protein Mmc1_1762 [Magnetococcus marinus MC-1]